MIAYKVVTNDRESAFVSKHVEAATLQYLEGTVVEADPNTMGIFCFSTKNKAWDWIGEDLHGDLILKVEGIGKPRRPRYSIATASGIRAFFDFIISDNLSKYYYRRLFIKGTSSFCSETTLGTKDNKVSFHIRDIPTGTITFKKVKVLE